MDNGSGGEGGGVIVSCFSARTLGLIVFGMRLAAHAHPPCSFYCRPYPSLISQLHYNGRRRKLGVCMRGGREWEKGWGRERERERSLISSR